jgi:CBS domain-containing protein
MQTDEQGFPVLDQGRLVGLVTLQDVRELPREQWETSHIWDIMTPEDELVSLSLLDNAETALELLSQLDIRQVPVLEDGELRGMVRRRDIVKWLQLQSGSAL